MTKPSPNAIEHDGGPCPVAPDMMVRVWLRGGYHSKTNIRPAIEFTWEWCEHWPDPDILFYEPLDAERTCTCHPDDAPPVPCAEKYALSECRDAPAVKTDDTEIARLRDRLFNDPTRRLVNFSFTPGPDATPESVCREINRALDEMEAGNCAVSKEAPKSGQPSIHVPSYIAGLNASLPAPMPAVDEALPTDVRRLVIAARRVMDAEADAESLRNLDAAAEEFASRVPWEDDPGDAALTPPSSAEEK